MKKKKKVKKTAKTVATRGRGRPPGSKNKNKASSVNSGASVANDWPMLGVERNWVKPSLKETSNDIRLLDIDHLRGIINLCTKFKLSSFQYGKLSLVFKKDSSLPIVMPSKPQHVRGIETTGDLQETSESVQDRLEYLKITEPEVYEDFMQSGEATDGEE